MAGEEMPELQHSEKFVKEGDVPEVRQPRVVTSDFDVLGGNFILTNS